MFGSDHSKSNDEDSRAGWEPALQIWFMLYLTLWIQFKRLAI